MTRRSTTHAPAPTTGTGGPALSLTAAACTADALTNRFHEDHPDPLIDPGEVISGGPPPDGIPPIDDPKFLPADEVDFLEDTEPVLALTVGDESRAYPVQVMIWHEIVNDTVDGIPVTVTYCPLWQLGDRVRPTPGGPDPRLRHVRAALQLGSRDVRPPDRDAPVAPHG